jgi:hypothetical protein
VEGFNRWVSHRMGLICEEGFNRWVLGDGGGGGLGGWR